MGIFLIQLEVDDNAVGGGDGHVVRIVHIFHDVDALELLVGGLHNLIGRQCNPLTSNDRLQRGQIICFAIGCNEVGQRCGCSHRHLHIRSAGQSAEGGVLDDVIGRYSILVEENTKGQVAQQVLQRRYLSAVNLCNGGGCGIQREGVLLGCVTCGPLIACGIGEPYVEDIPAVLLQIQLLHQVGLNHKAAVLVLIDLAHPIPGIGLDGSHGTRCGAGALVVIFQTVIQIEGCLCSEHTSIICVCSATGLEGAVGHINLNGQGLVIPLPVGAD